MPRRTGLVAATEALLEQETRLMPVDVRRAVELACKMADNVIKHRARLVTQFEPVPSVQGNESRLCQVFLNLLLNAAQAIPEDGPPAQDHEIRVVIRSGERGQVVGRRNRTSRCSITGSTSPPTCLACWQEA